MEIDQRFVLGWVSFIYIYKVLGFFVFLMEKGNKNLINDNDNNHDIDDNNNNNNNNNDNNNNNK